MQCRYWFTAYFCIKYRISLQIFLLYKSSNNWYHARYEHALQQVNMQHIERINTNRIYGINLITYFERIILLHGYILMNAARSLYNVWYLEINEQRNEKLFTCQFRKNVVLMKLFMFLSNEGHSGTKLPAMEVH